MPGWGRPWGGFRWIAGTDVPTLVLLRVSRVDHSRCLLSPFLPRANSFVRPLRNPASLPGPWRLYFSPPPAPPPPLSQFADLACIAQAAQTDSGARQAPRRRRLLLARLPAWTTTPPASRAGAAGAYFRRRRSPSGAAGSRGHPRSGLARFRVAARAEKSKSKTNTPQMKPARPHGSALGHSRGPGRPPPASF